jgi:hypothetical protein
VECKGNLPQKSPLPLKVYFIGAGLFTSKSNVPNCTNDDSASIVNYTTIRQTAGEDKRNLKARVL